MSFGSSAIDIFSPVAETIINLDSSLATISVSVFALFNGSIRTLCGWLLHSRCDRRSKTIASNAPTDAENSSHSPRIQKS